MEKVVTIVGILAGLLALYKIIVEVMVSRSGKRRDEYEFSKQFLSDLEKTDVHRLTLEKGFLALTGKIYRVEEIRLILSSEDPSLSINERSDAAGFISFSPEGNGYRWKKPYHRTFARKHATKWYYIWYTVTAFVGLIPVYINGTAALGDISMVAFSASLLTIAIMCLFSAEKYKSAQKFMSKFGVDA